MNSNVKAQHNMLLIEQLRVAIEAGHDGTEAWKELGVTVESVLNEHVQKEVVATDND